MTFPNGQFVLAARDKSVGPARISAVPPPSHGRNLSSAAASTAEGRSAQLHRDRGHRADRAIPCQSSEEAGVFAHEAGSKPAERNPPSRPTAMWPLTSPRCSIWRLSLLRLGISLPHHDRQLRPT